MNTQRGNILFLILLAVVLFAALSYAVTSSMRGGGKNADNEKAATQAASLINYFAEMTSAVQRMMLTGGVRDYELNFFYQTAHNFVYGSFDNTNCMASRCRVFDPAGGGVIGRPLESYTRGNYANPERIYYAAIPGAGTSEAEVIFAVLGVSQKTCLDINAKLGLNDAIISYLNPTGQPYFAALAAGSIQTIATPTSIPAVAATTGTYCYMSSHANWTDCLASPFCPIIAHIVLTR